MKTLGYYLKQLEDVAKLFGDFTPGPLAAGHTFIVAARPGLSFALSLSPKPKSIIANPRLCRAFMA
jgi:hypothetical protein